MRLRHPDGSLLHLAYCSNVHPADDLDGVAAQLERYTARVRERLDVPVARHRPVGRRAGAGRRGRRRPARRRSCERLSARGRDAERLPVQGVPRAGGQARRLLAALGAGRRGASTRSASPACSRGCCPTTSRTGSISTLPLGWREGWDDAAQAAALRALADLAVELEALERATGKRIRLALEPEPGCTVETIAQACDALGGLAPEWIGVCLDACHLAVQFEDAGRGGRAARRDGRADRQDAGLLARCASTTRRSRGGPRAARALRRAAVPAPGARARELARRGHGRPARGARRRRCRRSASGACTSTCRSTRPSTRRRTS